jgi:hypothetical protein
VPITGRKPQECFDRFTGHLRPVIAATLGAEHYLHFQRDGLNGGALTLGDQNSNGVWLLGKGGPFLLSLRQKVAVFENAEKAWQLTTTEYNYAIYETDDELADSVLRWDYKAKPSANEKWCRHHIQIGKRAQKAVELPFNDVTLDLNRLHMPTAFVLIEDVLRFLLTDMAVDAASGDWEAVIDESRETFFGQFSRRTSVPPPS